MESHSAEQAPLGGGWSKGLCGVESGVAGRGQSPPSAIHGFPSAAKMTTHTGAHTHAHTRAPPPAPIPTHLNSDKHGQRTRDPHSPCAYCSQTPFGGGDDDAIGAAVLAHTGGLPASVIGRVSSEPAELAAALLHPDAALRLGAQAIYIYNLLYCVYIYMLSRFL